jgi:N-acyl homoserine lactone hydrolase
VRLARNAMAACALALGSLPASAAGVDKLYVLYCGEASATDQSRWSPGVNVGVPIELSDNCYLIHHTQGWFLWGLRQRNNGPLRSITLPHTFFRLSPA